jgi:hypothetical protein
MENNGKYRDKDERRHETLNIIHQLRENEIPSKYPAVKKLNEKLNEYVNEGKDLSFSIPFPEMNKKIKGQLYIHKKQDCIVVLKHQE